MASLIASNNAQGPNLTANGEIDTGYDNYPPFFDMAIGTNSSGGTRYHAVWSNGDACEVYYSYSDTLGTTAWTSTKIVSSASGYTTNALPRIFISGALVIICTGRVATASTSNTPCFIYKRKNYGTDSDEVRTFYIGTSVVVLPKFKMTASKDYLDICLLYTSPSPRD